ncbi:MAG: UvrD-helicase domain-containing protein [Bacteroidales bacterium]|nr:UvrD-helicase domain-containing protein [Bacteroidales bacterium]MDD3701776.1 3'-5' exonuclease [Bacteroidales bacterium]MDY0370157.1 3'-5' exonuclease [Bacteroidales bacterium]
MSDLLQQLNDVQREAVQHTEGPTMIIAGAGSGKTRVLTYRIAYLLQQGIDPFSILALTFTNKAAREMKERVMQLVNHTQGRNVWMGTFHSVFAKILRIEGHHLGYPQNYTIYDTDDSKRLLKKIVTELDLDPKTYSSSYLLYRISNAKSSLYSPYDYISNSEIQQTDLAAGRPLTGEIFRTYNARLKRADAMDFDDLLFNTNLLFRDFPKLLYKYQHRFKYVLVDEYQDTNHAQYLIVNQLVAAHENLTVVGDDAQSIYAFRGANIQNILNFKKDYPDYKLLYLEQNYRSTKTIVEAANSVIKYNKDQIKKTVWTDNPEGEHISLMKGTTDTEEGTLVANAIFGYKMSKQLANKSFAILYRTNAQSRSLEEALRKQGIPYKIFGGVSFYNRKEVKDLLAYFRLVINPNDEEALLRIINYPARGIGKTTVEKLVVQSNESKKSIWELISSRSNELLPFNSGTIKKLTDFSVMVQSFQVLAGKMNAFELSQHITDSIGIIRELRSDDSIEAITRVENIEELLNAIMGFTERDPEPEEVGEEGSPARSLSHFMQEVALLTDADKQEAEDADYVSLMTIHAAKGLEFPYVFIVGLEENLFPSIQSLGTREELEEERRLFYVALTRAEHKVTISYAESRYRWGSLGLAEPSRFIEEIDPAYIETPKKVAVKPSYSSVTTDVTSPLKTRKLVRLTDQSGSPFDASDTDALQNGMWVEHQKFGKGKIIQMEGVGANRKATVYFNAIGNKQLLLRFAKLKIIES